MSLTLPYVPARLVIEVSGRVGAAGRAEGAADLPGAVEEHCRRLGRGYDRPRPQDVGHVVREVCRALQWDGLGNIQMMRRPEGDSVVYEINPRAAGSIGLTWHAGFDFPRRRVASCPRTERRCHVRGGTNSFHCFQARLVHGSALPVSSRDLPVRTGHFAHRGRARRGPSVYSKPAQNKEP